MNNKGFTLLEAMLVSVVVAVVLVLGIGFSQQKLLNMQIDRTTIQMQQILNAGLAYYVNNGAWPTNIDTLTTGGYLPPGILNSPWGIAYTVSGTNGLLNVSLKFPVTMTTQGMVANLIVGRLPFGRLKTKYEPPKETCTTSAGVETCVISPAVPAEIEASVNIPGQDLSDSTSINFAGLYRHGGCVPVPACPLDVSGAAMVPQVFVIPVSVSGVNDDTLAANTPAVYPISSFTAYATGTAIESNPPACTVGKAQPACDGNTPSGFYWRACVDIVTERGNVAQTRTDASAANYWGQSVTLGAFTRCVISTEPSGSPFTVFSN